MKIADLKQAYDYYSAKQSEIIRQLAFAGIAVVWIFKTMSEDGSVVIPSSLVLGALFLVLGLGLDLLHYVSSTMMWGIFLWHRDRKGTSKSTEFRNPRWINWAGLTFFWLKTFAVMLGYWQIMWFLTQRIVY